MRLSNFKKFHSWDTETTSLNLREAVPWQLAYTMFDHGGLRGNKEYWIWWPDLRERMSAEAARITQFDFEKYEERARPENGGYTLQAFWEEYSPLFNDPKVGLVGHNTLGYDTYIIANIKRHLGIEEDFQYLKEDRFFDTNLICKANKLGIKLDQDNFLASQYKVLHIKARVKTNLADMCKENDVPYDPSRHHAEASYDTDLAGLLFNKIKYTIQ